MPLVPSIGTIRLAAQTVQPFPVCPPPGSDLVIASVFRASSATVAAENFVATNLIDLVHVVAVDLDRDGDVDMLVTQGGPFGGDSNVTWFENVGGTGASAFLRGDGTTAGHAIYTGGAAASEYGYDNDPPVCVAADVNNDGWPDVVCSLYYANALAWFPSTGGQGEGLFSGAMLVLAQGLTPVSLAVGDLDGDGDDDIVASLGPSGVVWYANDGRRVRDSDVVLPPAQLVGGQDTGYIGALVLTDLNNDGFLDVAGAYPIMPYLIWWFVNGGPTVADPSRRFNGTMYVLTMCEVVCVVVDHGDIHDDGDDANDDDDDAYDDETPMMMMMMRLR